MSYGFKSGVPALEIERQIRPMEIFKKKDQNQNMHLHINNNRR